jgi:A/G-specific adenine glycosylase
MCCQLLSNTFLNWQFLGTLEVMKLEFLHSDLLAWFDACKRDLPWRKTKDPYQILLSEVLLQQTQVSRGVVFFERFMTAFLTVQDLAAAPLEAVLKAWEGAGYYARARNLHKAAQVIAVHGMPVTLKGLLELPGVGRYTAGAVASIAFGLPVPVVDGNVRRVLARWLCEPTPTEDWLWAYSEGFLEKTRPGDWNQAIMELGATVCTPKSPTCGSCPVSSQCCAFLQGRVASVPAPKIRATVKEIKAIALVVANNGRYLLEQRQKKGLLGGLHGFPLLEIASNQQQTLRELLEKYQIKTSARFVGMVQHTMTHRQFQIQVFEVKAKLEHLEQPENVALSKLDQKILALFERSDPSPSATMPARCTFMVKTGASLGSRSDAQEVLLLEHQTLFD